MADTHADIDVAALAERGLTPDQIVAEIQSELGVSAQDAWTHYWIAAGLWDGDPIEEPDAEA